MNSAALVWTGRYQLFILLSLIYHCPATPVSWPFEPYNFVHENLPYKNWLFNSKISYLIPNYFIFAKVQVWDDLDSFQYLPQNCLSMNQDNFIHRNCWYTASGCGRNIYHPPYLGNFMLQSNLIWWNVACSLSCLIKVPLNCYECACM